MSDWKYDLDEVGEDADSDSADSAGPERDSDEPGPDERERGPLEPGSPTAENALFVTLGVATTLFLFARVLLVVGG